MEVTISRPTHKKLMLVSGRAHRELAEEVASLLGVELVPTEIREFPDGEVYCRVEESVRGCDVFVIQAHAYPVNNWLMEHLILLDSLKRASAKRISAVMPYYGYSRQDKKSRGREPISARLMADLFKTAGATRLMSVDLHAAQIQGFFDGPVDHLIAMPIFCDYIVAHHDTSNMTVVTPDAGRIRVADEWSGRLGAPLAIIHKRRDLTQANVVHVNEVVGQVRGRTCLLVDDMIGTGGTLLAASEALYANGADKVIVAATHPVLAGPAVDRLKNSRISEVVVMNTLPVPVDKRFDKLTVLSIAPLLARAIREVFEDGSVTRLFDGAA